MSSFLDFARNVFSNSGWGAVIPPVLASLFTKKPKNAVDLGSLIPLYQQIAGAAQSANAFAQQQADFYNTRYRPMAINLAQRAMGVGNVQDQVEHAGRAAADYAQAAHAQEGAISRKFGGDPRRGGYGAAIGALKANLVPGQITAMNAAMRGREQYGDQLRQTALANLATLPEFGTGANIADTAASGLTNLANTQTANWRQEVADKTKAFKLPWDIYDEQRRQQESRDALNRFLEVVQKYGR